MMPTMMKGTTAGFSSADLLFMICPLVQDMTRVPCIALLTYLLGAEVMRKSTTAGLPVIVKAGPAFHDLSSGSGDDSHAMHCSLHMRPQHEGYNIGHSSGLAICCPSPTCFLRFVFQGRGKQATIMVPCR